MHDLVRVDHEVLTQNRQAACGPSLAQVVVRALEELYVGQHGQAGGPMSRIRRGDLDGIEVFADHSFRGRSLFDLGDDRWLALSYFFFQGAGESAPVDRKSTR